MINKGHYENHCIIERAKGWGRWNLDYVLTMRRDFSAWEHRNGAKSAWRREYKYKWLWDTTLNVGLREESLKLVPLLVELCSLWFPFPHWLSNTAQYFLPKDGVSVLLAWAIGHPELLPGSCGCSLNHRPSKSEPNKVNKLNLSI